jgi:hypothetical protein
VLRQPAGALPERGPTLSADQSPPASPAGPHAEPAAGDGAPPRLFFPDEPAVPVRPPRSGPPPGQPAGRPGPGQPPSQGQPPFHGQPPFQGQPPRPGQPPFQGQPPRPGQASRGQQPRRPRPKALPRRELRQRALAASVFGLISLFALSAAGEVRHSLYLVAFAFGVAVIAIVTGVSAARRARREETARPRGSMAAVILGSVAIFLSVVSLVAIVFATQFSAYETCASHAAGSAAKQACAQKLVRAVQHKMDGSGQGG